MLVALSCVFLILLCAFAIDIGYIALVRTQLQSAADAAALAGGAAIPQGTDAARAEAVKFALLNSGSNDLFGATHVTSTFGSWNRDLRVFTPNAPLPNAMQVTITNTPQPYFFGRIIGMENFTSSAEATVTFQPRDIMLALDYSGSMCYDSQLRSVSEFGLPAIKANLQKIYQELGSPKYGNMTFEGTTNTNSNVNTVKSSLGLSNVAYPFPSGSWDDFIDYVRTDSYVNAAGYRNKFGYLTFMDYLQAKRGAASQTPGLWKTSQQPLTALKNSVDVLVSALSEYSPNDRLGMSLYTSSSNTALVEQTLTHTYSQVAQKTRERQAGHYTPYTAISSGMNSARLELQNKGRSNARKIMVLMTDGQANIPIFGAKNAAINEANAAKNAGIPVYTISLGAEADEQLMQQIANITGGVHFRVPVGKTPDQYEEDLKDIFRAIAADRGLILVR